MNSKRTLCLSYLKSYANKDLAAIENMFSESIVLRDWKIYVRGKEHAMEETRKNFNAAESIDTEVLSTYENQNSVAAELKITVDKTEELYVVDVITFDSADQIASIRAYLGRADD